MKKERKTLTKKERSHQHPQAKFEKNHPPKPAGIVASDVDELKKRPSIDPNKP